MVLRRSGYCQSQQRNDRRARDGDLASGSGGLRTADYVHHREDEWFYVIEGELTFWVGGRIIKAPTGPFVYGPREIPHTFTVTSPQARSLVVTEPAGFEKFMRALGEPAAAHTIPPASVPLPGRDRIMAAAAEFGLEILARQACLPSGA